MLLMLKFAPAQKKLLPPSRFHSEAPDFKTRGPRETIISRRMIGKGDTY
jgi:hypothetical protein